ncbi:coenzyme F420-0:L-glutamate ligase, partial [Candidatus Gottesmanbacteria bacterium]|nr:coenzyme F420-0:L-glutamate ligase [Candidatus Gottesmanbacteria bacterium]
MNIQAIKTEKVVVGKQTITDFLDKYIKKIADRSILVITSKVVSIIEKNVAPLKNSNKSKLIKQEADYFLEKPTQYGFIITIKNNIIVPTSGIDESNGNNMYILWPKNPQNSANTIREYLVKKFKRKNIGVIITDSKTTPLRWGTSGICLAFSGFKALNNYIGKKDIFGRKLKFTKANIYDALAAASVLV